MVATYVHVIIINAHYNTHFLKAGFLGANKLWRAFVLVEKKRRTTTTKQALTVQWEEVIRHAACRGNLSEGSISKAAKFLSKKRAWCNLEARTWSCLFWGSRRLGCRRDHLQMGRGSLRTRSPHSTQTPGWISESFNESHWRRGSLRDSCWDSVQLLKSLFERLNETRWEIVNESLSGQTTGKKLIIEQKLTAEIQWASWYWLGKGNFVKCNCVFSTCDEETYIDSRNLLQKLEQEELTDRCNLTWNMLTFSWYQNSVQPWCICGCCAAWGSRSPEFQIGLYEGCDKLIWEGLHLYLTLNMQFLKIFWQLSHLGWIIAFCIRVWKRNLGKIWRILETCWQLSRQAW